jgi:hypothetical protein
MYLPAWPVKPEPVSVGEPEVMAPSVRVTAVSEPLENSRPAYEVFSVVPRARDAPMNLDLDLRRSGPT